MLLPTSRKVIPLALCLVTRVYAQNITASTCASPDGFTQCYNPLSPIYEACVAGSQGNLDTILACGCTFQLGELNCAMANCWNVVYGCGYQTLANAYTANCASPVPFFPAPDNAPGGCSCNLGYILYNATNVELEYKDCVTSDVDRNDGCTCCSQAAGYAALYDICPNTSTNLTEGSDATDLLDVLSPNLKAGECASILSQYDCSSLGFTGLGVPFMTSFDSATLGTQSVSNTNTRMLSSPASGATFTWTDLGLSYTIVAASANARATSGSSAVRSTSGATQGTASAIASASASVKNDARQGKPPQTVLTSLMVAVTLAVAFV